MSYMHFYCQEINYHKCNVTKKHTFMFLKNPWVRSPNSLAWSLHRASQTVIAMLDSLCFHLEAQMGKSLFKVHLNCWTDPFLVSLWLKNDVTK